MHAGLDQMLDEARQDLGLHAALLVDRRYQIGEHAFKLDRRHLASLLSGALLRLVWKALSIAAGRMAGRRSSGLC